MSSRYIPPHRRKEQVQILSNVKQEDNNAESITQTPAFQREAWQALSKSITGIINRVSGENVEQSVIELFRENLIRGRGLLARSLLRTQQVDPELTSVLASLISRINKELPNVVFLLCKRLVMAWKRAHARRDWRYLTGVNKFISWLYIFNVIDVSLIYQIILTHLTNSTANSNDNNNSDDDEEEDDDDSAKMEKDNNDRYANSKQTEEKESENSHTDTTTTTTITSITRCNINADEEVDEAATVFRETFKAMSQRARGEFYTEVLTPFRDLLAMDDVAFELSARSQAVLEQCLKEVQAWERVKDEVSFIPEHLILFNLSSQTTHSLDLQERYNTEDYLDRYSFDKQYEEHEEQYEQVRRVILGENWEVELLEQVAEAEADADEDEDEDEEMLKRENDDEGDDGVDARENKKYEKSQSNAKVEEAGTTIKHELNTANRNTITAGNTVAAETATATVAAEAATKTKVISEDERQIRKEVYMAMRSSIRADEAVHKILRAMKPNTEKTICFMVIEGCCEEKSFKRLYSMTAERLCKSNTRFQLHFIDAFHTRYRNAETLNVKQIEYTCKIYSHLLRTDSLYWSRCLNVIDIVHNDESQRLFIQNLLQSLTEEMGMEEVIARFTHDEELKMHTQGLFPVHASDSELQQSINLFVAMNVGPLAAPLRKEWEERTRARRKRERERMECDVQHQ